MMDLGINFNMMWYAIKHNSMYCNRNTKFDKIYSLIPQEIAADTKLLIKKAPLSI
jgi:hypothetical protein